MSKLHKLLELSVIGSTAEKTKSSDHPNVMTILCFKRKII